MFVIEQEQVRGLAWSTPGLLAAVRSDGALDFCGPEGKRRAFVLGKSNYNPRVVFSGDGRWLIAHQNLWDLAPTVAALAAGASRVPEPVNRGGGPGSFLVDALYDLDQTARRALRCVGTDLRSPLVQQLLELPAFTVEGTCPSPNSAPPYAAALSDRFVVWFDRQLPPLKSASVFALANGAQTATLAHPRGVNALTFSRDGRWLATAASGTVRVWDPESGECVRQFKSLKGNVRTVAFHPAGQFLAVSGQDEMVRFWDVGSGRELGRYEWGAGVAAHLAFSPDGLTAVAGCARGVVVWDVDA